MPSVFKQKNALTFTAKVKVPSPDGELEWQQMSTACLYKAEAERVAAMIEEASRLLVKGVALDTEEYTRRLVLASDYPDKSKLSPKKAVALAEKLAGRVSGQGDQRCRGLVH